MSTQTCSACNKVRESVHFQPSETRCIFCVLDEDYKRTDKHLHFLNSHPPVGENMQQMCFGCKVLHWWVNLSKRGEHKYCSPCLERKKEEAEEVKMRGEEQQKIQDDLVNSLFN